MSYIVAEVFEKGVELASQRLEALAGSPPVEERQQIVSELLGTVISLINQGGGANVSLALGHIAALGQVAAGCSPSSAQALADIYCRRSIPVKKSDASPKR